MAPELEKHDINLVLVYISEAHTNLWPLGLSDHPEPQKNIDDRIQNAQKFLNNNECHYTVLVDSWFDEDQPQPQPQPQNKRNRNYEEVYHAWPDKYILLDENHTIIAKSTYHKEGERDGKIKLDCVDLLLNLIQKE